MTGFDSQLLLHLRLDALPGGRVRDSSSHARHGTVVGRPQVVPDGEFGSSIRFGGKDFITVPGVTPAAGGANPALSVAGWVLLDAYPTTRSWLLSLGQAAAGSLHWLVHPDGRAELGVWGGGRVTPTLPQHTWVHVATVSDGTTLRCYLDGRLWDKAVPATFDYRSWDFGLAQPRDREPGLVGRVAGVRVYERVLSEADLRAVIDEDRSALAAFRRTHPLSFSLHDTDDQPVLAIVDDPTGQQLRLDVTNDASQTIVLAPIDPTTGRHHLELRFRPGILAVDRVDRIAVGAPAGWTGSISTALDGTVTVGLTSAARRELKPNETVRFGLHDIGADGRGGTRGTRVQLRYSDLYYPDEPSALDGSRVQYLDVVNRRGRKQIPLDVGFIGFNSILSDGRTADRLRLRIVNASPQPLPLTPAGQDAPSTFVLSFDTQEPDAPLNEWALGTPDQLRSISVAADRWTAAPPTEQGQTLTWRLTTPTQIALAAGEDIHVAIDGLIGRPPSGHTTLYVHYENIPGYWDGYLTATIEKGPLVSRDMPLPDGTTEARVGIGVAEPRGKLHIVHTPQDGDGDAVIIGPTTASNLRLGYHADYSWVQSHGARPLALNPVANQVGIGRTDPDATLDVARGTAEGGTAIFRGSQRLSHFNYHNDEHTYIRGGKSQSNVYLNDNGGDVAIGSTDPQGNKLLVHGVAKVLGLRLNSNYRFDRLQGGQALVGTHGEGVKEVTVTFPERFGSLPLVLVTAHGQGGFPDTFAVSMKHVDTTLFRVNILRLDQLKSGWNQDLRLDWIAWE